MITGGFNCCSFSIYWIERLSLRLKNLFTECMVHIDLLGPSSNAISCTQKRQFPGLLRSRKITSYLQCIFWPSASHWRMFCGSTCPCQPMGNYSLASIEIELFAFGCNTAISCPQQCRQIVYFELLRFSTAKYTTLRPGLENSSW